MVLIKRIQLFRFAWKGLCGARGVVPEAAPGQHDTRTDAFFKEDLKFTLASMQKYLKDLHIG